MIFQSQRKAREVREKHGLFELYIPKKRAEIDIVAVHGLNGTEFKTWTHPKTNKLWLRDFLPEAIPGGRVMTFGYDSAAAFSTSTAVVDDFAKDLLNRIHGARSEDANAKDRPLLFICHSLGGIIVKRALSSEFTTVGRYKHTIKSTHGVIFMGTPHRGSDFAVSAGKLSRVINFFGPAGTTRPELLGVLETDSGELWRVSQQFAESSKGLRIVSFYECKRLGYGLSLVVPQNSAILGLVNELAIPISADHREMCRFPSRSSQLYQPVERAVQDLVADILLSKDTKIGGKKCNFGINVITDRNALIEEPSEFTLLGDTQKQIRMHTDQGRPTDADGFIVGRNLRRSYSTPSSKKIIRMDDPYSGELVNLTLTGDFDTTLKVPPDLPLVHLWKYLIPDTRQVFLESGEIDQTSLNEVDRSWFGFFLPGSYKCVDPTWRDVDLVPVAVTSSGRSQTKKDQPLSIHNDETLASFFSRVFPIDLDIELRRNPDESSGLARYIIISRSGSPALEISFQRTLRAPNDGLAYSVPTGLGRYPLFNVEDYSRRLPDAMVESGGSFLPMFDLEAMGVVFSSVERKFAARVYVGGVNAVSGDILEIPRPVKNHSRTHPPEEDLQDYIVIPDQLRLDGIAIAPGHVAQFVSTPRGPMKHEQLAQRRLSAIVDPDKVAGGASIEHQLTGSDSIGGIQLEIVSELDLEAMYFSAVPKIPSYFADGWPVTNNFDRHDVEGDKGSMPEHRLDPLATPAELGFAVGDVIYMKNVATMKPRRPKVVADLGPLPCLNVRRQGTEQDAPAAGLCYNRIYFISLTHTKISLQIPLAWFEGLKIGNLKESLEKISRIPHDRCVLMYRDYVLQDYRTLWDYDIQPEDTLLVTVRLGGGANLRFQYAGRDITLDGLSDGQTLLHIKRKLAAKLVLPASEIALWINNNQPLNNENMVYEDIMRLASDTVIFIKLSTDATVPPPELAIGAGGLIRQIIKKDKLGRGNWDWNNAKLCNIGVLNAQLMQRVTGVAPPVSLMTANTATLSTWGYGSGNDGMIAGDFRGIRTLAEFETEVAKRGIFRESCTRTERMGWVGTGMDVAVGEMPEAHLDDVVKEEDD